MFCRNCGKELCEKAFVCTECGCLVETQPQKINAETKVGGGVTVHYMRKLKTFLILSAVFLAVALVSVVGVLCTAHIHSETHINANGGYSTKMSFYFESAWMAVNFYAGLFALGMGIPAFVMGHKKKVGEASRLITIVNFIFCIAMMLVAIIVLSVG